MNIYLRTKEKARGKPLRGFTLIETLVSAFMITSVVLGPLTVALNASANARMTKDTMTAAFLAQESVELLRMLQDTVYLRCTQESDTVCAVAPNQTASDASWSLFISYLRTTARGNSCFSNDGYTPAGCSYDVVDMTGMLDTANPQPFKHSPTDGTCTALIISPSGIYVCNINGGAGYKATKFSRSVVIDTVYTMTGSDSLYNADLRVTSSVSFARPSGYPKTVKFVDFLHARS